MCSYVCIYVNAQKIFQKDKHQTAECGYFEKEIDDGEDLEGTSVFYPL